MVRASAPPLVKICGNQSPADIIAAARSGADFVGIIFADSPRKVTVQTARAMVRELGSPLNHHELHWDHSFWQCPPPFVHANGSFSHGSSTTAPQHARRERALFARIANLILLL